MRPSLTDTFGWFCSHVTMSVVKLLSRIVNPFSEKEQKNKEDSQKLHDHTYGITSDRKFEQESSPWLCSILHSGS